MYRLILKFGAILDIYPVPGYYTRLKFLPFCKPSQLNFNP